jgi:succinyl-diaminopimelate desuccinylase
MPSVDPAGEAAIAQRLADRLDAAGLAVEVLASRGRTNLVARLPGAGARPVCLSGHLDTVPVGEADWARDPFGGDIHDGLLHGRGACDMKGGVAAAVVAADHWAALPAERRPGLLLVLSGGEEVGCEGVRGIADGLEPASAVVVLEPTGGKPRLGHRGVAWLDVAVPGVAAHASTPHLGRSAILAAARAVVALDALEHGADAELGPSTLNVGRIDGGSAPNIVADRCALTVDVRMLPGQTARQWADRVRGSTGGSASVQVALELPAVRLDPAAPEADRVLRALGLGAPSGAAAFFTDASVLATALDAPAIVWGPGDPALAHAVDERCPTGAIADVTARLVALPDRWREAA